jgi:hypothetical protein
MYAATVYLYQQIQKVLLVDNSDGSYFDRRWSEVYSKKLKLNLGVDNVILFAFENQDQKPVNISGSTFTFRLISQNGEQLLLAKELVSLNNAKGRAKVTITSADINTLFEQPASWSIEQASGNLETAVLVDAYSGARGDIEVNNSVYPAFVPSKTLTIPAQAPDSTIYYTSTVTTEGVDQTTFVVTPNGFTGEIRVNGAVDTSGDWYDITFVDFSTQATVDEVQLVNSSDLIGLNVPGYHPYLRLEFVISAGSISNILYR